MTKQPRRRCKICREWFHPRSFNEWWCSPEHGAVFGIQERDKQRQKAIQKAEQQRKAEVHAERQSLKIRKLSVKPLSYFAKQAQQAFNAYIRERDSGLPCISCGRYHEGQYHAGHYRTVGAHPELRFNEDNCHGQCAPCNNHLSGNIANYTPNLIAKIGRERYEALISHHEPCRYTRVDFERIRDAYRAKLKDLKENREVA
ncbi:recombination protein NinG [Serratia marcescens]|uniref:recombination protein NinG n=1 Tax=Serratia marcescens TaxID=615 RepID=UPI00288266D3|nr:recombination protein NinG [Serratia marcescens]MDT0208491.1 recombination protein NinG [Serratia marcescens]